MGSPALVELDAVAFSFGARTVLHELSFALKPGERVALLGSSGAGKTTALRLMAGILPPTQGHVRILGVDTTELRGGRRKWLRRQVGFLYQTGNLVPQLRVVHNVAMGRLAQWSRWRSILSLLWPQEVPAIVAALDKVELADRVWDYPGMLSGGEAQRVAVARLLLQDPQVMLADEPASSLDVRLAADVVQRLCAIAQQQQKGLVISLHALELLGPHFDRVVALRDGRVCWQGTIDEWHPDCARCVYDRDDSPASATSSTSEARG